jgi:hypothetical protein
LPEPEEPEPEPEESEPDPEDPEEPDELEEPEPDEPEEPEPDEPEPDEQEDPDEGQELLMPLPQPANDEQNTTAASMAVSDQRQGDLQSLENMGLPATAVDMAG